MLTFGVVPITAATLVLSVTASVLLRRAASRSQDHLVCELVPAPPEDIEQPEIRSQGVPGPLVHLATVLADAANLSPSDADALRWAALLHDSGFTETAAGAASSAEPLDERQLEAIREHPLRAAMKVGRVGNLIFVAHILETHHEHYNGWGYPFGLQGDDIPFPAALLGVAEAYLALTTPRPYRSATLTPQDTLAHIKNRSGEQFHPAAVAALETALTSALLNGDRDARSREAMVDAIARLRRAIAVPRLGRHAASGAAGSDLWLRGTGSPYRFLRMLLTRDPVRVVTRRHHLSADWYRSLFDLSRVFSSSLQGEVIADRLAEAVHRLVTHPSLVWLVGDDGVTIRPAAVHGIPATAVQDLKQPVHEGIIGLAFSERRSVISLDLGHDPRAVQPERVKELGIKSSLVVPVLVGDTPLGIINVVSHTAHRFSPDEVAALESLANVAGLALHNAALYRKASERLDQLVKTQFYLRKVLDVAPVGILALGPDGRVSLLNERATTYLAEFDIDLLQVKDGAGGEPTELTRVLRERVGTDAVERARELGLPWGPETAVASTPEGDRHFQVWATPLREGPGAPGGVLVLFHDVTESRRLEADMRRNEKLAAVGEVAAKAAHEIKNPLTALQGFTQLMGLYCPVRDQWEECPKYVERMTTQVERLLEITHSMLALARPVNVSPVPGDLAEVVRDVLDLVSGQAARKGTLLEGPIGPAEVSVPFDARQLRQVLLNLVQNAVEAAAGPYGPPPGERRVTATLGYTKRGGRRFAFIQVRDNGPGIRAEERPQLFTPFFTTKETGTGLGLAVSKSIVEAHGGTLEVRRVRGHWTVFEVLLPTAGAAGSTAEAAGLMTGAAVEAAGDRGDAAPAASVAESAATSTGAMVARDATGPGDHDPDGVGR